MLQHPVSVKRVGRKLLSGHPAAAMASLGPPPPRQRTLFGFESKGLTGIERRIKHRLSHLQGFAQRKNAPREVRRPPGKVAAVFVIITTGTVRKPDSEIAEGR
jgi:hypothetical protein